MDLNQPELALKRCRQLNRSLTSLIGLTASPQALGSWVTKNPTCIDEHPSGVVASVRWNAQKWQGMSGCLRLAAEAGAFELAAAEFGAAAFHAGKAPQPWHAA